MKKIIIILSLVLISAPFSASATSQANLDNLKQECFLPTGALINKEWIDCQNSILNTVSGLDLITQERSLISTTRQEASVGALNEIDTLAKQIENMQIIVNLLQSILARYSK
ncbi:MAG: hypothetical protein AAB453_04800 [Patescibacteria group bacterium]